MTRSTQIAALMLLSLAITGAILAQTPTRVPEPEATPPVPDFALLSPEMTVEPSALRPETTAVVELPGATRVEDGGISFLLPSDVADEVEMAQIEAVAPDFDALPSDILPAHTVFGFAGFAAFSDETFTDSPLPPTVRVFDTADFADYEFGGAFGYPAEHKLLVHLLDERPDLSREGLLPLLPLASAAQVLHARERYVAFNGGKGISYLTTYAHDVSPIIEGQVLYVFQGISDDGQTYVSAMFPIFTDYLPREIPDDFDYDVLVEGYETYIQSIRAGLNEHAGGFIPSLDALDALVGSITVEE